MDKIIIGILIVLLVILVIAGYEWHSWNTAKQAAIDAGIVVDNQPGKPITKVMSPEVNDAEVMKQVIKQAEMPPIAPPPVPWPVKLPVPTMTPTMMPSWRYESNVSYIYGRVNYKQDTNGILYLGEFKTETDVELEAIKRGCVAFSWHGKYTSDNPWYNLAYGFPAEVSTEPTQFDDKIVSAKLR